MASTTRTSFHKKLLYGALAAAGAGGVWIGVHDAPYLLACPSPLSPLSYDEIVYVGDSRYMVRKEKDGLWGMIDEQGRVIMPPRYSVFHHDSAHPVVFSDNRLPVGAQDGGTIALFDKETGDTVKDYKTDEQVSRMGYIDRDGNEVIALNWHYAGVFQAGYAVVINNRLIKTGTRTNGEADIERESRTYHVDTAGDPMPWDGRVAENRFTVYREGKAYLVDEQGKTLSAGYAQIYDPQAFPYADGRLLMVRDGEDGFGLIAAADGREVLAPRFRTIIQAGEYLVAAVADTAIDIFDLHGAAVIAVETQEMRIAPDGTAMLVKSDGQWQIRDLQGNVTARLPQGMELADTLVSGKWIVMVQNGLLGLADWQGHIVQEARFADIGALSDGRMLFQENGKYGFFDEAGKIVIPAQYAQAKPFRGGVSAVQSGADWQIIDTAGNVLADRLSHTEIAVVDDKGHVMGDGRKRWFGLWGQAERVVMNRAGDIVPVHHLLAFDGDQDTAVVDIYPGTGGNLHEIPYLIRWRGTRDYLIQQDGCLLPGS